MTDTMLEGSRSEHVLKLLCERCRRTNLEILWSECLAFSACNVLEHPFQNTSFLESPVISYCLVMLGGFNSQTKMNQWVQSSRVKQNGTNARLGVIEFESSKCGASPVQF